MNHNDIKQEVTGWLEQNWSTELSLLEWRNRLLEGGWAAPNWPVESLGRGYSVDETQVVNDVFRRLGIVFASQGGPRRLAAETILAHGNDEQKQRYLKQTLTGEHAWCQLFSEPGSGSDLAGSSTKAEKRDGRWIINGQKVWTTSAHHADYGILLARSDWDLPKHQGLSYFLIDMHQPGVEVRPLRQMNGHASFNEVFMTDAEVSFDDLLGGEGNGWAVAASTLSVERRGFAQARQSGISSVERVGRVYDEYEAELAIDNEPYTWYPQRQGRVDLVLDRAKKTGAIASASTRQEIAKLLSMKRASELAAEQAEATRRAGTNEIIPAGSIGKLAASVTGW